MLSVSFAAPAAPLADNVLACIRADGGAGADPRVIGLTTPAVGAFRADELWTGAAPARPGVDGRFRFAHNGAHLFGHTRIAPDEMADTVGATQRAYAELGGFLERHGYRRLLRSWNYIHDIHRGTGDDERYKQFCVGRHRVVAAAPGYERSLPAATVIGTAVPGMLIYFLAGKQPGAQVENPRQTPAFRYPREYGPASPSFSRATLTADGRLLLMSGTASVVGHATRHPHDSAGQLDEMLANVAALLRHAGERAGGACWSPRVLRVFLRDAADLPLAQARIRQAFGPQAPVAFMQGDICRSDLRLEMEGVYARAET